MWFKTQRVEKLKRKRLEALGILGMAEMVQGGTQRAIRRAIVIGNGFAGAENQSIGLVRALGLSDRQSLYVSIIYLSNFV
jgi:hypothetical protein